MALAQGMPLKMDQEFPSNKFVIPIGFFKQKFTGELAGFENNPSDYRSGKKMMRTSHLSTKNCSNFFSTPFRKKTRGCRSWSLPTSLRARWVSSEKKKRQQCSSTLHAVSQELQFGKLKKPTLQGTNISPKNGILKMIFLFPRWDMLIPWRVKFHSSFTWSTKWHSHQQFTGFSAIGHKVHAYENSGSKWFFSQRKIVIQWLFLVPLIGGRYHIIPQLAVTPLNHLLFFVHVGKCGFCCSSDIICCLSLSYVLRLMQTVNRPRALFGSGERLMLLLWGFVVGGIPQQFLPWVPPHPTLIWEDIFRTCLYVHPSPLRPKKELSLREVNLLRRMQTVNRPRALFGSGERLMLLLAPPPSDSTIRDPKADCQEVRKIEVAPPLCSWSFPKCRLEIQVFLHMLHQSKRPVLESFHEWEGQMDLRAMVLVQSNENKGRLGRSRGKLTWGPASKISHWRPW